MGKEERSSTADKRHYILIAYVMICVAMIFMTLVIALTPEEQVAAVQATQRATNTRNSIILTAQADYATIAPTPTRGGS